MTFFEQFLGHFTISQELEFFLRIVVASLCGALIGFERTRRFKEAGIRTHILVAAASSLMMIVSKYGFADLAADGGFFAGTSGADASRIASQVITGISFLGAGVIFKLGSSVRGLTTAAGIWATSGIGLAIGAGMYFEGIFVTALIIASQFLMHRITIGKDSIRSASIIVTVHDSALFRKDFEAFLGDRKPRISYEGITKNDNGTTALQITITHSQKENVDDLVSFADSSDNIISLENTPII